MYAFGGSRSFQRLANFEGLHINTLFSILYVYRLPFVFMQDFRRASNSFDE